nr:hypothetical protein [Tanacetum cinerariifolium]
MLLAMKDEAGSNLSNEENDFMLDTSYREYLEELTASVTLMARHQPADDNAENVPSYDAKAIIQLKSKLRMIDKGKNVKTKFDTSETLGKLLCVTSFNKKLALKAKNVSNTKVSSDRPKPVTSQSTPTIEKKQQYNANVIARGMYKINQQDTQTPNS